MNEQIEKIYGEACITAGYLDEREFLEKFAELIVRECAGLCSNPVVVLQHWGLDSDAESVL